MFCPHKNGFIRMCHVSRGALHIHILKFAMPLVMKLSQVSHTRSFPIRCLIAKVVQVSIPSSGRHRCVCQDIEKVTLI